MTRVLIVGGSVGGVRTAQALRAGGFDGGIVVAEAEAEVPYDKPPLSKGILTGAATPDGIRLLTPEQADAAGIGLRLGMRATGLDTGNRTVTFADGSGIGYDHLVLATGAAARRSPWGEIDGVHVVRTLADTAALRRDLAAGGPLVVIGAGFVGAEVAASARRLGLDVTVIDPQPLPMTRSLSADVAAAALAMHEAEGVRFLMGAGVTGISGSAGRLSVALDDGTSVAAAAVVVGIGAVPNVDWLASSGLTLDDGVVCDAYCRAEGARDVYAVGDAARWFDRERGRYERAEHWTNAVDQAACVAHNILHPQDLKAYTPAEFVWSDQHDWKIQVVGDTCGPAAAALLGDPTADRRFAALHADDEGRLRGAVVVNWPRGMVQCRRAVRDGTALRDVETALRALADAANRREAAA